MFRFAQAFESIGFATGVTCYQDVYPGEEQAARIVLPVVVEGRLIVTAIVDTGAPWCVLDPEITHQVGALDRADYRPGQELTVRGTRFQGRLVRMIISLEASEGESLDIEATVFVPTLLPGDTWQYPNFIGLDGFLSRVRFAVDPSESAFYFGPV